MIYYIIPARKGSKGLPGKNRILFNYTARKIPDEYWNYVFVTTDDEDIMQMSYNFNVIERSQELSCDTANIRDVLLSMSKNFNDDDIFVLLYLTYPQRTWDEIKSALNSFYKTTAKSLLCCQPVRTHPYLCIYKSGLQVVEHDLYRRQDYPECREISHYIAIVQVSEIKKLNKNLYNNNTFFYEIDRVIDIDTQDDLDAYCTCNTPG